MNTVKSTIIAGDCGLLLIRLMLGVVFMFHGSQKLFGAFDGSGLSGFAGFLEGQGIPFPHLSAVLAACAEFIGGLLVLIGFAVRVAVVPMVVTMLVAVIVVHGDAFSAQNNGMEYPLTLAVMLAGLGLIGPGRLSASAVIARDKLNEP